MQAFATSLVMRLASGCFQKFYYEIQSGKLCEVDNNSVGIGIWILKKRCGLTLGQLRKK